MIGDIEEDNFEDPVNKFPITTSLEPCKSKFFGKLMDEFMIELNSKNFKIFTASYNYNDDFDGKPTFIVNNFLNGLVHQLEDKRKYLFAILYATKLDDKYIVNSSWISNCTLSMKEIIPDKYSDFTWDETDISNNDNLKCVCEIFNKCDENMMISYLH